jgi:hypothetical protein
MSAMRIIADIEGDGARTPCIANVVTFPASNAPVGLSLVASRSCPLQMTMSLGGAAVTVPVQVCNGFDAAHPL